MNNKKNIDRLFQEKFKDFEVSPDPKVWQNIESRLKKEEKDDRVVVIPFWLKLSGIAASLLLFFFLGNAVLNNSNTNSTIPNVVDTENNDSSLPTNTTKTTSTKEYLDNTITKNADANKEEPSNSSSIVINNNKEESNQDNKASEKNNSNRVYVSSKASNKSNVVVTKTPTTNNLAQDKPANNKANTTINNSYKNTTVVTIDDPKKEIINNYKNQSDKTNSSNLNNSNTDVAITDVIDLDKKKEEQELKKPSIEDAIAEAKNTEDLIEEEENTNRWSVNTNIAPVYYNSFGEGSHLDEQFNSNAKTGEINTSYGVKVGYALNDNLTIRSGINKLNLGYDTNDVVVYEKLGTTSNSRNNNYSMSLGGQELNIIDASSVNIIGVSKNLNAGVSQQMSYYEMPLEVEYKLLKKRFGINIIGGFSTFILDSNQLTSQLNGVDTRIGEANNINNFSFSTNVGIGLDYKFNESMVFNLEPTFKYHLNAFNNTSGSFNPYIIGIYTGISYRF